MATMSDRSRFWAWVILKVVLPLFGPGIVAMAILFLESTGKTVNWDGILRWTPEAVEALTQISPITLTFFAVVTVADGVHTLYDKQSVKESLGIIVSLISILAVTIIYHSMLITWRLSPGWTPPSATYVASALLAFLACFPGYSAFKVKEPKKDGQSHSG